MEVLGLAIVRARAIAIRGSRDRLPSSSASELAALTDAIHNIPSLVLRWETCDQQLLVGMLAEFDAAHASGLAAAYKRVSGYAG